MRKFKTSVNSFAEVRRVLNSIMLWLGNGTRLRALEADPPDPKAGESVTWLSDGTGTGDAGDYMIKINIGGTIKTATLADYSGM